MFKKERWQMLWLLRGCHFVNDCWSPIISSKEPLYIFIMISFGLFSKKSNTNSMARGHWMSYWSIARSYYIYVFDGSREVDWTKFIQLYVSMIILIFRSNGNNNHGSVLSIRKLTLTYLFSMANTVFKKMKNKNYYKQNENNEMANSRNSWQSIISGSFHSIVIAPFSHSQNGIKCGLMSLKNHIFLKKVKKRTRLFHEHSSFDRIPYKSVCSACLCVCICIHI